MLKQSPIRNQRSKGFKVKNALQISLLIGVFIWLVYQLKHSYDKKALEESSAKPNGDTELGRKGLHPLVGETSVDNGRHTEKEEESEEEVDENEDEESEEEGRGGGDDDRAEEEPEVVEDLIDEDDTEREEDSEDKGTDLEDQVQNEDTRNKKETREENYKGDDASSGVKQNTDTISNRPEIGSLRE